jgi:hypothetical protein
MSAASTAKNAIIVVMQPPRPPAGAGAGAGTLGSLAGPVTSGTGVLGVDG